MEEDFDQYQDSEEAEHARKTRAKAAQSRNNKKMKAENRPKSAYYNSFEDPEFSGELHAEGDDQGEWGD